MEMRGKDSKDGREKEEVKIILQRRRRKGKEKEEMGKEKAGSG